MADVVMIRPDDDPVAKILFEYAREVLHALRTSGVVSVADDLTGSQANRARVQRALLGNVDCVLYYGHGERDRLFADGTLMSSLPAALDKNNASMLADKIVYAVACSSADELGPEAVNTHNARTYIGYDDELFIVCGGAEYWFQRAANTGVLSLILAPGTPCRDAMDRAGEEYDAALDYYKSGAGATHYNAAHALKYLQLNKDRLVLLGDQNASL